MIVLEGPNGCGKSTLARQLAEDFGYKIFKFATPSNHFAAGRNANMVRDLAPDTILDRHPAISNAVYGPIMFGSESDIPVPEIPILVYCYVPISIAMTRHVYCKADPFDGHEITIYTRYENIMRRLDHIRYDWTFDSYAVRLAEIERRMK